ncbi:DUF4430 domain-containing protein [Methermicoccus shengliensis]|uniref:DUF4430 domain-containing protein n=1 Tax=Methermicoccus shengliensis TaxID=660064 RepID=A0A832VZF2_9EURY|nr:DUF4430 domain-containing protein [Methermicoccus shengliensis]MDI3488623.1 hypothetical protein [Methanosarcinales archaeon]HIH69514.1 DUF4430 domain-containing protein [Methermicoccus shengliensis]
MRRWLALMVFLLVLAGAGCVDDGSGQAPTSTPATTPQEEQGFEFTTQQPAGAHTSGTSSIEPTRVVVTLYFGKVLLLNESVPWQKGLTAMDALRQVASVETAYGGGFVNGINGYVSKFTGGGGQKVDWFYTVNGFPVDRGAPAYVLHPGDVQIWDYHEWAYYGRTCVVGAFPEPFVHGYNGVVRDTLIVYEDGLEESAQQIAERLRQEGATRVSVITYDELTQQQREQDNIILVGTYEFEPIHFVLGLHARLNIYTYIENGKVVMEDVGGKKSVLGDGGIIVATNSPWNPRGTGVNENMVWVVAGTSKEEANAAAELVAKTPERLHYFYSVAVVNGDVVRVPQ